MNLTLLGQMGTFAVLVFFVWRFLWGPLTRVLEERTKRIADGLAAAERGKHEQELAERRAADVIKEARSEAQEIIARGEKRATEIIEESKSEARAEGERLLTAARAEIEQEINRAREGLRVQVAALAVAGAERILGREIDQSTHTGMLDDLVTRL